MTRFRWPTAATTATRRRPRLRTSAVTPAGWELASLLRHGARVVDLSCGAGIPATRELASYGLWGARRRFLGGPAPPGSAARPPRTAGGGRYRPGRAAAPGRSGPRVGLIVDARGRRGPAGLVPAYPGLAPPRQVLPAIVGAEQWTGIEHYLGADMFWDHADTATYLDWLTAAHLVPVWHRYIPEGDSGHTLILARAAACA